MYKKALQQRLSRDKNIFKEHGYDENITNVKMLFGVLIVWKTSNFLLLLIHLEGRVTKRREQTHTEIFHLMEFPSG